MTCVLVDLSFCADDTNTIFVKNIAVAGIKEKCKTIVKELKYKFPVRDLKRTDIENYSFGHIDNEKITNNLINLLEKFDIILTNGKLKVEFLKTCVKGNTRLIDISRLQDNEHSSDFEGTEK